MHDVSVSSGPSPASPPSGGPLPIPYTAEEVGRTFADLLATFDFATELHELGIGKLNIAKRAKAKKLLTAVSIVLWHVALEKSFPHDADAFFSHFIATYPRLKGEGRSARKMRDLVARYDALAAEKKDADFTVIADTLVSALHIQEADRRRQQLKLSLRVRSVYELIFEKLI
ncbi:MAG: hypothetical protein LIP28_07845 [Deltaproteobacteria bacterium]|nr:hypothetical protein [Deltaproteobacteria bacterium]